MLLRLAERYPGGKTVIFGLPAFLLLVGLLLLTPNQFTQVDNSVILGCTLGSLWTWRHLVRLFWKEEQRAANLWLSLGLFVILLTTAVNSAFSYYIRAFNIPLDSIVVQRFGSIARFGWAFGFGCVYLVPMAEDTIVPPRGWVSLFVIVGFATALTLIGFWYF